MGSIQSCTSVEFILQVCWSLSFKNWRFESLKHFLTFPESFTRKQEYGLTILVSSDAKVNHFLDSVLSQIKVNVYF